MGMESWTSVRSRTESVFQMDHLGSWIEVSWLEMSMMITLIKPPIRIEKYAHNFILSDIVPWHNS